MNDEEREGLKAAILTRFPSVYAFCKAYHGSIGKSTVVLLLAGRYPGNVARQAARIRALLAGGTPGSGTAPDARDIIQALERNACPRCKTPRRKNCRHCRAVWAAQAGEILRLIGCKEVASE